MVAHSANRRARLGLLQGFLEVRRGGRSIGGGRPLLLEVASVLLMLRPQTTDRSTLGGHQVPGVMPWVDLPDEVGRAQQSQQLPQPLLLPEQELAPGLSLGDWGGGPAVAKGGHRRRRRRRALKRSARQEENAAGRRPSRQAVFVVNRDG